MISSPEEARLLFSKWMAESSRVLAFASSSMPGFLARMEGTITSCDDIGTSCLSSDGNFMVFNLDCSVGYGEQAEMPNTFDDALSDEAQKWTTVLLLEYSNGERLALCTMD